MYLLAFVTLVIAFIGTYAQVLELQTARFYSQQSNMAQAMEQWHTGAVSMAVSIIKTNPAYTPALAAIGCSLTNSMPRSAPPLSAGPNGINTCPSPQNPPGTDINASGGTITDGAGGANPDKVNRIYNTITAKNECVHLPTICTNVDANGCTAGSCNPNFDKNDYQFYSFLFQKNNQNYVVTFVQPACITPANPAPGFVNLAITKANPFNGGNNPMGGLQTSLTASDLLRQMKNSGLANYTYGTINIVGGIPKLTVSGGSTYDLPTGLAGINVPGPNCNTPLIGGVAIIGSPDGF